ncbi:MAG: response regulator [Opitutus sp.]
MKSFQGRQLAVIYFGFLCLHAALDISSRIFELRPGVCLWYPPVGLSLALATLLGARCFPVVLLAHIYSAFVTASNLSSWTQLALPVMIASVYVGIGTIVHHWFGAVPSPKRPMQTAVVILLHLFAPLCASALGAWLTLLGHDLPSTQFVTIASGWLLGDLTGIMTVVPLCYVHLAPRLLGRKRAAARRWSQRDLTELLAQGLALVLCLGAVNGFGYMHVHQAYYLTFVPLVWICLRHGFSGATIAILLLTMGSLASFQSTARSNHDVADLLAFEVAVMCIGFGLGATVSRRWRAEGESARLLAILERTPDLIGTTDLEGRMLYQNAAFLRLQGSDPVNPESETPRALADAMPEWAREKLVTEGFPTAISRGHWQAESAVLDQQGREIPVSQLLITHYDRDGRPGMLSTIARDISAEKDAEQKRLETERNLLQTQKLESLGVLAGGIAHDFNNLLTVMLGNASLARLELALGSPAEHAVHQIELAALRAAELCRQMLAYAGKGRLASELVDLTELVEATTDLLKVSISKKCALEFSLSRDLPPIFGDATQLNQIAMNLVMNASDACGDHGGHIIVRTGLMQADRAYLARTYLSPTLEPGAYVFFEVTDNGAGMSKKVLSRIFEPFFTTKFSGHGLGLSAVLGIARSHLGAVKVDSVTGHGTTFRLLFPAAKGAPKASALATAVDQDWRGNGCILIVDDEDAVRETAARILTRSGFTTVSARNGQEAVEIFARQPDDFSAILLDLTMPVMDGHEAFRQIHRLNASIPVIIMSGYNRTDSAARFAGEDAAGFVQKPFQSATLLEALQTVLKSVSGG